MVEMRRSSGRRMALWRRPPRFAAVAAGVGTRTQQHKSTKFADQNDAARAFKLRVRPLPRQEFSVELCPNGNRLWCPEHGSLIPRPVVPENPTRCGLAAMAAGPTAAIPTRFLLGWACDGPHEPFSGSARLMP